MGASARRPAPERRRRILEAARYLVLRQGLRGTTMEAIARQAGIAKPTLYSYFADKQAVFGAIVDDLAMAATDQFDAALTAPGDRVTRIGKALAGKHKVVARLLEGSPHADELYGEHDRGATPQFRAVEQHVEAAIIRELDAAGVARPRQLAQLLMAAGYGVARKATTASEIGPAIRVLTERLLRPELRA